jgi:hypothetical protein
LTSPYLTGDGYSVFDLPYFSELTYINKRPRVCFHDSAEELSLSLNFSDKESLHEFGNSLRVCLTGKLSQIVSLSADCFAVA